MDESGRNKGAWQHCNRGTWAHGSMEKSGRLVRSLGVCEAAGATTRMEHGNMERCLGSDDKAKKRPRSCWHALRMILLFLSGLFDLRCSLDIHHFKVFLSHIVSYGFDRTETVRANGCTLWMRLRSYGERLGGGSERGRKERGDTEFC